MADSSEAADTLVDLMQMFRDKKNIFGRASELLCRLISASAKIKVSVDFIVSLCLPFFLVDFLANPGLLLYYCTDYHGSTVSQTSFLTYFFSSISSTFRLHVTVLIIRNDWMAFSVLLNASTGLMIK